MTTERHHTRLGRGGEVALLVEYPVVGQVLLEVTGNQLALLIEGGGVIERLPFTPGMAHQNGASTLPCRDAGQRGFHPDHQVGAQ